MSSRRSCKNKWTHKQNFTIERNWKKRKIKSKNKTTTIKKTLQVKGKVRGDQYKTYAHYSGVESVNEKNI